MEAAIANLALGAPGIGEQGREILTETGTSDEEISALIADGIVIVGAVTTLMMPAAILILILAPPQLRWLGLFAAGFGIANGIITILRGIAPAEWLGREHYGKLMGAMGAPMMVAAALAPLTTAAIWSKTGDPAMMLWAVFGVSLTGTAGFWFAVFVRARRATSAFEETHSKDFR